MSWIREDYIRLEGEGYGYVAARDVIEGYYGEGILHSQQSQDYAGFQELHDYGAKRGSGDDGTGNRQAQSAGGRNDGADYTRNSEGVPANLTQTAQQDVSLPSNDGTGGIVAPSYTQNRQQLGSLDALSVADKKAKIRADIIATAKQYGIDDGTVDAIAFIAERTGTRVVFVDEVLTHNGTPADAKFDRASHTIFVSKSAVAPVYAVVKHELTHAIAGTELYNRLVDFVKHSSQMKAVLQRISEKNGLEQLHFEDLVDSTIKQYEARGEVLDNDGATEEIVAKFVAEFLLNDQATVTELFKSRQNVFYKLLYNLRQWTKRATLDADTKKLRAAEQLFVRAMAERGKRYYKSEFADTTGTGAKYSINPDFGKQYASWDKKSTGGYFYLGTTSKALESVGINSSKIYWDKSKIVDILNNPTHHMEDVIPQVPELLENPVLVMQSNTRLNRVTVLGDLNDGEGFPVLCALELTPKGEIQNFIKVASAYGKEKALQSLINTSEILYVDPNKKRTNSWLQTRRLQLPVGVTNYGSIGRVALFKPKVKGQFTVAGKEPTQTAMQLAFEKAQNPSNNQFMQDGEKYSVGDAVS